MFNLDINFFGQVSLNPVQILNQGAEEERAETARLVSAENIFCWKFSSFLFICCHGFPKVVSLRLLYVFLWSFSPKKTTLLFFSLEKLVCKSNLSHPAFTVNCRIPDRLKSVQIWSKCLPFNSVLSVVFCWCHCHRRPHQEHSWSKRNGKDFYIYYNLFIFITTDLVVQSVFLREL